MSEAREVRPVIFGQTGRVRTDFRPLNDPTVEEEKPLPKDAQTGLTSRPAQEPPQSEGAKKMKSKTPSSSTSSAEATPESSSASLVPSLLSVKNTEEVEESATDSGADETKPTEEKSWTTTVPEDQLLPTPGPPTPTIPKLPF